GDNAAADRLYGAAVILDAGVDVDRAAVGLDRGRGGIVENAAVEVDRAAVDGLDGAYIRGAGLEIDRSAVRLDCAAVVVDDAANVQRRAVGGLQQTLIGDRIAAGVEDERIDVVGVDHAVLLVVQCQVRVADGAGAGNRVVDVGERLGRAEAVDHVPLVVAQGDFAAALERQVESEGERAVVERHRPGIIEGGRGGGKFQDATVESLDGRVGGIGQAAGHVENDAPAIGLDQAAGQIGHAANHGDRDHAVVEGFDHPA